MALTPQQSDHLGVLKTIERLGGSASYEKHLSKSSKGPALSVPSFPNHDPVFVQIEVKRLLGSIGGTAEVRLISGITGNHFTLLEFWVDEAPGESTAGGVFAYMDWNFLLTHEVNFSIEGAQHFDAAAITFSYELGIIGKIDLLGSWSLAGVKEAHGTCKWSIILQAQPQGQENPVLKMIKDVEEMGGSEEYARSLTYVPEIPGWSPATPSGWPSTLCSVKTARIGMLHTCTITDVTIYLGTQIKTFFPLVPDTPNAKLFTKPGVKLEGLECGWFVTPGAQTLDFFIGFYVGTTSNVIAVVEGQGLKVQRHVGGENRVKWIPINAS